MEQILRALERDARLTPAQIAEETGHSEDEVRTLIAEAEERQLLLSFGAKVNWANAGRPNVYALVEIKVQPEENVGYKAVARRISRFDEVLTCYFMSGEYDLAVIVVAPSIHEISNFVGEKVATLHGVQSTITHVIMRRFKEDGVLLDHADEEDRQKVVFYSMAELSGPSDSRLAQRVHAVPPSDIRRFFDLLASMDDVISLGVGEPDFVTPWPIRDAAIRSIEEGHTHYTSNFGIPELREQFALHLERLYGLEFDPYGELLITSGVSEGLDIAMRAIVDPGDEVILADPAYAAYRPAIQLAEGVPVTVGTTAANAFSLDPAAVAAAVTDKTKAILLGYPANPTGAVISHDALALIGQIAVENDLLVVSDEIYDRRRRLMYEGFGRIGLPCVEPLGAFYTFPSIAPTGLDDETFAEQLLLEERVAVVPGSAFGDAGRGYVRACYATSHTDIERALERIQRFVVSRTGAK